MTGIVQSSIVGGVCLSDSVYEEIMLVDVYLHTGSAAIEIQ